ncbi:MAG TPA: FecR domain-containing protein [Puia sp.]
MVKQRLLYLLNKQEDKRLTDTEHQELEEWYALLNKDATDLAEQYRLNPEWSEEMLREFRQNRLNQAATIRKIRSPFGGVRVAAILVGICLTAGIYFFFSRGQQKEMAHINKPPEQIRKDPEPGGNKAILTLANGMQIVLDSASNGTLAIQGNVKVTKLANGRLAYSKMDGPAHEELFNTMSTPRGGQYELVLPDGTKAWLNSASAIRYPTTFTGRQRTVEISGEAYFEVAPSTSAVTGEKIPFKVSMYDGEEIEVLGTHFNVNAYPEEGAVKTTLLEGSVRLTKLNKSVLIVPGQQAILTTKGYHITTPDLEKVIAWKAGFFDFDDMDLATIMRQISRWYDVDVVFHGKTNAFTFGGRISRNLPLSNVLKMFEENGVAFRMEGKVLHVEL